MEHIKSRADSTRDMVVVLDGQQTHLDIRAMIRRRVAKPPFHAHSQA